VALLWKMICNLGDPMSLRHPVPETQVVLENKIWKFLDSAGTKNPSLAGTNDVIVRISKSCVAILLFV